MAYIATRSHSNFVLTTTRAGQIIEINLVLPETILFGIEKPLFHEITYGAVESRWWVFNSNAFTALADFPKFR